MHLWKLGGAICDRPEVLDALCTANTGPWAIVHGAGPQLDAALRATVGEPVRVQGLRVTTPEAAEVVVQVMDEIGAHLTGLLQERGVAARHVPASSRWLQATVQTTKGDLQRVGEPLAIDHAAIEAIIEAGEVPVLSPAGWDDLGPLNVNADDAACAAASALNASTLSLMSDVPAVLRDGVAIERIGQRAALRLIDDGHAIGGMVPKLRSADRALDHGVNTVRIGDARSLIHGGATAIDKEVEPWIGTA